VTNDACLLNKICIRCSAEVAVPGGELSLEKRFEFASLHLLMVLNVEVSLDEIPPVNIQHEDCVCSSVRLVDRFLLN
jgi:hypothetical protein